MRILVVSQFYSPDITAAAFRIRETVDLMMAHGLDVRVITSKPHKAIADGDAVETQEEHVCRVNLMSLEGGGMRRYLQHYLSFVLNSLMKGVSIRFSRWRPDVIWTTSPPLFTGITGSLLAKIWGCPLVFDIRDIWPESAVAAGQISVTGRAFTLGKWFEKKLYDAADHITCVSRPMSEYIEGRTNTPVSVVYNGVLRSAVPKIAHGEMKKRILYAGNLGRVQGLESIVQAFAQAVSQKMLKGWTLEFIGSGALEQNLRARVNELGMGERIFFHPPVRKDIALEELAKSALLFINLKDDSVFSLTIPSKVFDYMVVNRPILFGIVGEGHSIMQQTGGNVSFVPSDAESLLQALQVADQNYTLLAEKACYNRAAALDFYSREQSVETLISLFEQMRG